MTARSAPSVPGARPLLVPDARALRAFWDHVVRPGDVHEVRLPQSRAGPLRLFGTVSGYFDDPDAFVSALRRVTGADASAVYITLNPVKTALLARARNRLENRARSTASDGDVLRRRLLLIDIDPVRDPKDISATDLELAAALARRDLVAFGLSDGFGWPDPLLCATSGNGGALLYRIDLPNDDASTALMQRVLAALDANWSDAAVKLDVVNYNAARITKVIGSVAAKGENLVGHPLLADRPWRLASASYPAGAAVVSAAQLAALAADGPQPEAVPTNGARLSLAPARTWTVDDLLSANGLHASARSWQGGGMKYPLDHCLTSPDHCDGACLIEMPSGAIVYRCHHDRCSGKGWSYLKEHGILRIPGQEQRSKASQAGQSGPEQQARAEQQAPADAASRAPKANGNGHGPQADARDAVAPRGVWVRLSTVVAEQVEWVWPARIPKGKLTLIGGDPGVGKSFLLFAILTHVTRGWAWPDGEPCPGPADCILLCGEDGLADTVRPRVDALGGDPTRVWPFKGMTMDDGTVRGPSLASALDVAEIERKIAQTDARLVLVDPINTYLDPKMDTFKGPPVRAITTPLAGLAERTGVAVVLVCHLTKATLQQALYRMPGSVDFVAAARSVLAVGYDPQSEDGRRLLLPVKNNLSAHAPGLGFNIVDGALRWDKDAVDVNAAAMLGGSVANGNGHGRDDAAGTGNHGPNGTKADAAAELLRLMLGNRPHRANDVLAATGKAGVSKRTVMSAKATLGVVSTKGRGDDATWWWSLPSATAQPQSDTPSQETGYAQTDATDDRMHSCTVTSLETDSDVSLNRNGHAESVHRSATAPEDQQGSNDATVQPGDGEPAVDDGEDWPF